MCLALIVTDATSSIGSPLPVIRIMHACASFVVVTACAHKRRLRFGPAGIIAHRTAPAATLSRMPHQKQVQWRGAPRTTPRGLARPSHLHGSTQRQHALAQLSKKNFCIALIVLVPLVGMMMQ